MTIQVVDLDKPDRPAFVVGLGARLKRALQKRKLSVLAFSSILKGKRVRGSTTPALHSYLNESVTPPLPLLIVSAEVLGVRFDWLARGQGGMTEAEEEARQTRARPLIGSAAAARLEAGIEAEFASFSVLTYETRNILIQAGLRGLCATGYAPIEDTHEEFGRRIGALLGQILDTFIVEPFLAASPKIDMACALMGSGFSALTLPPTHASGHRTGAYKALMDELTAP